MNLIMIAIQIGVYLFGAFSDVKSTKDFSQVEGLEEMTKQYRLPNGKPNMPKIYRSVIITFAIGIAACTALLFSGWSFEPFDKWIAFAVFPVVGIKHYIAARSNKRLIKTQQAKLAARQTSTPVDTINVTPPVLTTEADLNKIEEIK